LKIGVLTAPLGDRDRKAAFATVRELGYEAVELGTGEFTTDHHVGLERVVGDEAATEQLRADLAAAGLELAALSCHGNPLHPNPTYAERADRVTRDTIRLAADLGVGAINLFSGCPGTPEGGDYPNWVVHPWPLWFGDLLAWQWRERVIPYWTDLGEFAAAHGVGLAIEMHPSNVVYTTDTLLRLRAAAGDSVGANFDPSHLWWQGMDPIVSLRAIAAAGALFNVHVKDTVLDPAAIERSGVIAVPAEGEREPWRFGTVGHGHGADFWARFFDELVALGFTGVLSVEHEDELAPVEEALAQTIDFLRSCSWRRPPADAAWLAGNHPPYPNPDNPWGDRLPDDKH
jgi:sugar phosphate isomerase/epimerase